jgi:hypothetical protein
MARITKEDMKKAYKAEMEKHIAHVNEFAKKICLLFPEHDIDKITEPAMSEIAPYAYCDYYKKPVPYESWARSCREARARHWKQNPHHPEHWENIADMTDIAIKEMCCDWSAATLDYKGAPNMMHFYENSALKKIQLHKAAAETYHRPFARIEHVIF